MPNRREFLTVAGAGAVALAARPVAAADSTWLSYAVNAEMFWKNLPFLERLKKIAEAGFTRYEFWQWKTKDIDAIARANEELGLQPTQFTGYWGITNPKKKEAFLQAIEDSVEVAQKLGATRLTVVAGEMTEGLDREEQVDAVVDALKAAAEKAAEADVTLILEPLNVLVDHPRQLIVTSEDAAAVIKAVGSKHVKILFDVYHQQISEGNLSGNIKKYKDLIGYYQIADHPGRHEPSTGEIHYPRILKLIHDVGYTEPIGLELWPQGDPLAAIKAVREADAAAKAL